MLINMDEAAMKELTVIMNEILRTRKMPKDWTKERDYAIEYCRREC